MHYSGQWLYLPAKMSMAVGGRGQDLGWAWRFVITAFTWELNLFYLKVNLNACSHDDCQSNLVSRHPKTRPPGEHVALLVFTASGCLLTSQTHPDQNMKSPAKGKMCDLGTFGSSRNFPIPEFHQCTYLFVKDSNCSLLVLIDK